MNNNRIGTLLLSVAVSAMQFIANQGRMGYLQQVGITKEDYDLVTGNVPWTGPQRSRCTNIIKSLLFGSTDQLGLPRFVLPAEYVGAGIAIFVAPINSQVACIYMEDPLMSAEELARDVADDICPVKASQLFALVQMLLPGSQCNSAKALFEKNTGLALKNVIDVESKVATK